MGNCQAIDNATILIQHPNGRTDKLYCPVPAAEVMKTNPGHHVALLLTTTTVYSSAAADKDGAPPENKNNKKPPLRITRIKLLRPADTLVLGHVYRLVTTQEVTKGLWAKKQQQQKQSGKNMATMREKNGLNFDAEFGKTSQVNQENHHRSSNKKSVSSSSASKYRGSWQPALKSISESAS